jgi:3-deoxy-D-manno-octulosonate 8-phosphate phosphatase (KDO 8-P phosphatase)
MDFLEINLKGICAKFGIDFYEFLSDFDAETVHDLRVSDLEVLCSEYELDLHSLLFSPLHKTPHLAEKLSKIKLLILDDDGVMTDGGMYFTENGDQFKKFNTKDGMAILHLTKQNFQVGIISSGFKGNAVQKRAEMLGIQHVYVGRDSKLSVLESWCESLSIRFDEVAIIGDDINDLEVMNVVGFKTCPQNAVPVVKKSVDLVLSSKGGDGCVREFIDNYLLKSPLDVK